MESIYGYGGSSNIYDGNTKVMSMKALMGDVDGREKSNHAVVPDNNRGDELLAIASNAAPRSGSVALRSGHATLPT
ncbi:unnamed protein product [Dovyalis caffra]|uniref:Uncharacterized protein n=1 Tax=Dovyalis caffra TaxID=77055 RepID=A0AAV1QWS6_9ROSI|nr:unnamed protein product [Dovyalis caffra]